MSPLGPTPRPAFFATPAAFRAWLARHHGTHAELWVGFRKRSTGAPSITWPESVDEALCFGWIDGLRRSLDPGSYVIRFTPRKSTSIWSAKNTRRYRELLAAGRVRAAGRRAFAARREDRSGVYSFENRSATLPAAYLRRLRADAAAWAYFTGQPPWYRRTAAHWVTRAKQEATRERRFAALLADSAAGQRVKPLRRPE